MKLSQYGNVELTCPKFIFNQSTVTIRGTKGIVIRRNNEGDVNVEESYNPWTRIYKVHVPVIVADMSTS